MDGNLQTKNAPEVTAAYSRLLQQVEDETEGASMELTGDLEGAYRSAPFQKLLSDNQIVWRPKIDNSRESLAATATLDSRIGVWQGSQSNCARRGTRSAHQEEVVAVFG